MGGETKRPNAASDTSKKPNSQKTSPLPTYHNQLSSETRARAFFTTSSRSAFTNHCAASRSHSVRALNDKVFYKDACTNRQGYRSSAVLPMHKSQFCETGREYQPKSLDNVAGDNELARIWLQEGRGGGEMGPSAKMGQTTNAEVYKWHTKEGRAESCKPENPAHVDPNGKLLETISSNRRAYALHDPGMAGRMRGELMPLRGECAATGLVQVPNKSLYGFEHRESQYGFARRSEFPKTCNPVKNFP